MVTERRQSPRCKPFGLVYLSLASDNGGIVLDASEDGLQFQAVAPVERDDGPVPMWFTLNPANRIETVGEIVWTDESKKTGGLRFTNLEDQARVQIRQWLAQNGCPLPVRTYASPVALSSSEPALVEERESQHAIAAIPDTPAIELEDAPVSAGAEITLASTVIRDMTPEPILSAISAPAIVSSPIEPTPTIHVSDPQPPSEAPAITMREIVSPVESAPVIPQRVAPTLESIKEEPVVMPSLSYETAAPAEAYSGYDSEGALREVAAAGMHRHEEDLPARSYGQPVVLFPAPLASPPENEPASPYKSHAGISVRTSDYAEPWRPVYTSAYAAIQKGERVSRLAELLVRAGVPGDLVRDVEILIVVLALVLASGVGLLIFHRQVGEGVQLLGQNLSSKKTDSADVNPVKTGPAPPDSTLSPLLQPPAATQPSAPVAVKRKPKTVYAAGATPNSAAPAVIAADPNAPPPLPDDTGEAELATALQYLRGSGGSTEVTNVGVKWLWASVEKGNTKAAIILADLYTWGRGVPQNCDQARVLLTAAAKRANSEAAQRLQDMAADGCASGSKTPAH